VRLIFDIVLALAIALVIGVSTAWYAVQHGYIFGAVEVGPWTAWPTAGTVDADPYSLATLARTGEVPLGTGEGIAFAADKDSSGEPLTGSCVYALDGQTPAARLWTLTAYDEDGRLMVNPARRSGFHSREVLRKPDGSFLITVSPDVAPGNWLPVGHVQHFRLVLRLYDTPLTTGSRIADLVMPAINRRACS
jgi:hypothetical protein